MSVELQIVLAFVLDALIGDPRWLPHPVKLIGWLAIRTENVCRAFILNEKVAGAISVIIVLFLSGMCGWGLIQVASVIHPYGADLVSILLLYSCFAARDLIKHSNNVYRALQENDLEEARKRVGMIVGRNTEQLSREGVSRACVESVAENTVDGVTAPLFWAIAGGPVGALLYKAINTLDSTFGYKNEQYLHFGLVAARLDDLANWLPARITGLLTVAAAGLLGLRPANAWRIFWRDRGRHVSPNAGQTEAAFAGALGVRLGGGSVYFGQLIEKPTIGDSLADVEAIHILQANRILLTVTLLVAVFLIGLRSLLPA